MVGHGLELQIVSRGVLEEHSVLFAGLALESQGWFNNEFDVVGLESIDQFVELFDGFEGQTSMRYGNLVAIDGVVVIDAPVVIAGPVTNDLVTIEGIVLPLFGRSTLLASQDGSVEFFGFFEGMNGKGVVEGISRSRRTSCFVFRGRFWCCREESSRCSSGKTSPKTGNANGHRGEKAKHDGSCSCRANVGFHAILLQKKRTTVPPVDL